MSSSGRERPAGGSLAGSQLGSYELVSLLGSGGMGEVYRARDTRLGREVAVKVLPAEFSEDRRRLQRFEREARAVSALNHPAIVTVYEIGSSDSLSYIAMELVEGKTLRSLLSSGPLPSRKLLEIAIPVAEGLARAHGAGIVHRDLKPENIMVSKDGFVKILDFGLAKWTAFEGGAALEDPTLSAATEPGVVLGTVGYMSPEQAGGRSLDFRSDQFSFGSLLYEMATGKRAFRKDTAVDTLSAILHEEPKPVGELNPTAPLPLRWIVERCLAKDPRDRYASTADLARDLSSLREHISDLSSGAPVLVAERARRLRTRSALTVLVALAALSAMYVLGTRRAHKTSPPRFRQLTSQSAAISTARFTPDGRTIVYSAQWEGKRPELFETRLDHPESRSLGLPAAQILSISRSGYMAILLLTPSSMALRSLDRFFPSLLGTLAQVPLAGGAPRELLDGVFDADWAPNGKDLAVVRYAGGKFRLEFPVGTLLHEHRRVLWYPRVSPRGDHVSFLDASRNLLLSDLAGHVKATGVIGWQPVWSPVTGELMYRSWRVGGATELRAISADGKNRLVTTLAGDFALHDISPSGQILLGQVIDRSEIFASVPGETRDLRLYDNAAVQDVSASGDMLTFASRSPLDEQPTAYLGRADGSPAKRLGSLGGRTGARLSPDGKFVMGQNSPNGLIVLDPERTSLLLVPTGAGQPLAISTRGLSNPRALGFSPDGKKIYFAGDERGHGVRVWVQDLAGGNRRPISPEGIHWPTLSDDRRFIVTFGEGGDWNLYPTEGGEMRKVVGLAPGEEPIQWTSDGKSLYVRGADEPRPGDRLISARVYRLDPWNGHRQLWKEILPISTSTGGAIGTIRFAANGKICFYNHDRSSSELFLVDGLR